MSASLIAIVDDDDRVRDATASVLRSMGYATCNFASGPDLLGSALADIACVLSDYHMPGMTGLELLTDLKLRAPHVPVIIMTAYADKGLEELAALGGAAGFVTKPLNADRLARIINAALA